MSIVLMYHRVANTDLDPYYLSVSPSNFREHLAVLRKRTTPRRLIEIVDNWSDTISDIAVTFDDGYADNFLEGVPALEAEEVPATIFVSTGMLDSDGFWIDRLTQCLLKEREYPETVTLEIEGRQIRINLRTSKDRQAAHRYIHSQIRNLPPGVIETVISGLADVLGVDPTPPKSERPLSSQEAAKLAAHPLIELGGHTVTHPCLPSLKPAEQQWEIETCKSTLRALGAPKELAFAYPFGDSDSHSFTTRRIVRKSGWHHAVIAEPTKGWWFRRYAVPRYYVGNWDGEEFERRLVKWLRKD